MLTALLFEPFSLRLFLIKGNTEGFPITLLSFLGLLLNLLESLHQLLLLTLNLLLFLFCQLPLLLLILQQGSDGRKSQCNFKPTITQIGALPSKHTKSTHKMCPTALR